MYQKILHVIGDFDKNSINLSYLSQFGGIFCLLIECTIYLGYFSKITKKHKNNSSNGSTTKNDKALQLSIHCSNGEEENLKMQLRMSQAPSNTATQTTGSDINIKYIAPVAPLKSVYVANSNKNNSNNKNNY